MRTAFFGRLLEAAKHDRRIVLITGDLGFGVVDEFRQQCPEQFINAGVAEQGMTGLAAGMALAGAKVFTYSIANFPTLRCLEQIRNDIAYHGADVTVVAVGGGLAYGALGMSHHATEDLAIMRAIPGLAVAAPGDACETVGVMNDILATGGPAYLRLGKAGEPVVHARPPSVSRGCSLTLRSGGHGAVIVTGGMLPTAVAVVDGLRQRGLETTLVSMPWIQPLDEERVLELARAHDCLVTIEEHVTVGGLGGAVSEVVASAGVATRVLRIGLPHRFISVVGDQEYLRKEHGLDRESLGVRIAAFFEEHHAVAR